MAATTPSYSRSDSSIGACDPISPVLPLLFIWPCILILLSLTNPLVLLQSGQQGERMSVAYPYGCSLEVKVPAVPVLSSGQLCFPANRAIAAYAQVKAGRLLVLGSAQCFDDAFLPKADNGQLATGLLKLLADPDWKIDKVPYVLTLLSHELSSRLLCCL
jgi:hypothetical protein